MKYCLSGFLDKQQRDTLLFLDVLARVLQETGAMEDLDNLEQDMNTALALIERDFPVSAQVGSLLLMFYYGILRWCINECGRYRQNRSKLL